MTNEDLLYKYAKHICEVDSEIPCQNCIEVAAGDLKVMKKLIRTNVLKDIRSVIRGLVDLGDYEAGSYEAGWNKALEFVESETKRMESDD